MRRREGWDPIRLEVFWNRMISIASEQAAALVASSFSAVLGEMEDLSAGLFDETGTMLAQSVQGAPGHLGSLSLGLKHFVDRFPPSRLAPGDVLVTNDPWLVSGHKHDITVVTPVFRGRRLVGFSASNCHTVDIGGRIFSAMAAEVLEEGLTIAPMKLFEGGRPNATLLRLLEDNVRSPELVLGDLMAQVSANDVAARKLRAFMDESGLDELRGLAGAITDRTARLMRAAIARVPDGTYRDRVELDGFGRPLVIAATVTVKGDRLAVDFAGTSPQVDRGVNCVLNFTKAFTYYALKCALAPDSPNNDGTFQPIGVAAPEASILNAAYPAPVGGRHLVGLFIPFAIFGALARVLPDRVIADSSVLGAATLRGVGFGGRPYVFTFFCSGGMGGRPTKDGLDATAFPSNVANVPVEVMEHAAPVLVTRRELIADSGGRGRFRGGAGQRLGLRLRTTTPAVVSCMFERVGVPPRGLRGGEPGRATRLALASGTPVDPKQGCTLMPGEELVIETPGGGGYGPPSRRDARALAADRAAGLTTARGSGRRRPRRGRR